MRLRRIGVLALPALVAACVALTAGSARAAGPVCTVPGDYPTIQAAVNDTNCTTIDVGPGTYNEQVQISRSLTLNGAQAGVDARGRSGSESIITNSCGPVQLEADNVTINGFTIEGSTQSDPCFIAGLWTNTSFSGSIVNNIVQENVAGIELDSDCNGVLVQHNLIQNNNQPARARATGSRPTSGSAMQPSTATPSAAIRAARWSSKRRPRTSCCRTTR